VKYPYLLIAGVLIVIAFVLSRLKLPEIKSEAHESGSWSNVMKNKTLQLGALGIFAYVGAEVAIGTFLVNYIINITPMPETEAAHLVALYWGGAMVGRFLGIYTLKAFAPGKVLSIHSMLAIAFILISTNTTGMMSVYSLILVGFCNSIMFPTIFTLGIKDLGAGQEHKGSGILATAIIGGAFVPVITGKMIDANGFSVAFMLPVICYAYIAFLGLKNVSVKALATGKIH
jgi:FHS family L-fucose permease-like MFS transporter